MIADWNPVSAVAGSCRELFANPDPAALTHSFPGEHPVVVALAGSAALVAICAPTASALLRTRTTD